MKAEDIKDEETLWAWLEGRPREDAVAIAHRTALRMLPIVAHGVNTEWAQKENLSELPILRCLLISAVGFLLPQIRFVVTLSSVEAARRLARSAANSDRETGAWVDKSAQVAATSVAFLVNAEPDIILFTDLELWDECKHDAEFLQRHQRLASERLWKETIPEFFQECEARMIETWNESNRGTWNFWRRWWEGAKAGRYLDPQLQLAIVREVSDETWDAGPDAVAEAIREIEKAFNASKGGTKRIADAAYFDFIEVNRQMRAVGFPTDYAAFSDPEARAQFSAAVAELEGLLGDWCELARAQLHGRNRPVTVVVSVEQLLDQLQAIARGDQVSLRDLVRRGSSVRRHSRQTDLETDLGDILYEDLTDALDQYSELVRLHMGEVLASLDALRGLDLGDLDSAEVLASLKAGVARLQQEKSDALLPPDARTQAILNDMVAELEDEQAEIDEASTDAARSNRRKRFAEKFGGVSATFGRYLEKGSELTKKGGERFDGMVKWYKRWETLEKIVEWWNNLGVPTQ